MPGHWEGDLLIGKRNATAIATLVERASGFAMLVPLPDGYKPEHVAPALARKVQTLPEALRRSLTWDQGPEMRDWKQIHVDAGIEVFFCDPHAPWQRGSNENTNGLLRQYFPKGTDFSTVTTPNSTPSPTNSTPAAQAPRLRQPDRAPHRTAVAMTASSHPLTGLRARSLTDAGVPSRSGKALARDEPQSSRPDAHVTPALSGGCERQAAAGPGAWTSSGAGTQPL